MRFPENATAVLSPGQGAVPRDSAKVAYDNSARAQEVFEIGTKITGIDLYDVSFGNQRDELEKTEVAQVAIPANLLAEFRYLEELGLKPDAGEGHSVGEIPLLAMAEVITIEGMFKLLKARGTATARASKLRPGMMAVAKGISYEHLESEIAHLISTGRLVIANLNAELQYMLSGDKDLILEAKKIITERSRSVAHLKNAKISRSRIGGAFHSPYHTAPATRKFRTATKSVEYGKANFDIMLNNGLYLDEVGTDNLGPYLVGQLGGQVLFSKGTERMINDGIVNFYELGDRPVLSDLVLDDFSERARIIKIVRYTRLEETGEEN